MAPTIDRPALFGLRFDFHLHLSIEILLIQLLGDITNIAVLQNSLNLDSLNQSCVDGKGNFSSHGCI
jgi:hypothetical protein